MKDVVNILKLFDLETKIVSYINRKKINKIGEIFWMSINNKKWKKMLWKCYHMKKAPIYFVNFHVCSMYDKVIKKKINFVENEF